jgi:Fur family ferric uptake transcriptional regulator
MSELQNLRGVLKNKGQNFTRPRKLVFEALLNGKPKSIAELVTQLSDSIDRASIYRTVELFEKLGIIHRVNTGWKYKLELSDMFIGHHHHLHCSKCGKIESLPTNPMLETMIDKVAASTDFSPRHHQLEVYGLCLACSKSQS